MRAAARRWPPSRSSDSSTRSIRSLNVRGVAEVVPGLGGLGEQALARAGLERGEGAGSLRSVGPRRRYSTAPGADPATRRRRTTPAEPARAPRRASADAVASRAALGVQESPVGLGEDGVVVEPPRPPGGAHAEAHRDVEDRGRGSRALDRLAEQLRDGARLLRSARRGGGRGTPRRRGDRPGRRRAAPCGSGRRPPGAPRRRQRGRACR